mmetsp:Transcript_17997/g.45414  ORF Transcript_17997/g.45414 Transcript_17997/m.45414 type:complete len:418 (+) Transcript_17997:247-1500(+)
MSEPEELELTPRPVLPWEVEHTHHEHGDLALVDSLFSAHQSNVAPSLASHAPAAPVTRTEDASTSASMRYVFIDGDGQIQEANQGQALAQGVVGPGQVPAEAQGHPSVAAHLGPSLHLPQMQIESTVSTAGVEGDAEAAAPEQHDSELEVDQTASGFADCKACRGHHTSHTCGTRGKSLHQKAKKYRTPATAAASSLKVKGEPQKLKSEGAKASQKASSLTVESEGAALAPTASAEGVKLEIPLKRTAAPMVEGTAPLVAGSASSFKPGFGPPEYPPHKTFKLSSSTQKTVDSPSTPPPPPPTPEPPSPKPLPCCTFECCPNPLHTSGGWKRVTSETRAGGRDWTMYYGRLFCNACFTQYATTGSMTRKGRPQQENPYLAGGPMQIPTEKPRVERHERVHAGGMALRAIKETNRLDL